MGAFFVLKSSGEAQTPPVYRTQLLLGGVHHQLVYYKAVVSLVKTAEARLESHCTSWTAINDCHPNS